MGEVLVLDNVEIRRDSEGRYCLNDLHKAAGNEERHAPALWERQAGELISVLEKDTKSYVLSKVRGRTGGTYVCKELVYAYAMWISPAFNIKVIRAFDTLQTKGVAVADHAAEAILDDPFAFMEEMFTQAKALKAQRDALKAELEVTAPKALVFDNNVANQGENLNRFVRSLKGVNTVAIKGDLALL